MYIYIDVCIYRCMYIFHNTQIRLLANKNIKRKLLGKFEV